MIGYDSPGLAQNQSTFSWLLCKKQFCEEFETNIWNYNYDNSQQEWSCLTFTLNFSAQQHLCSSDFSRWKNTYKKNVRNLLSEKEHKRMFSLLFLFFAQIALFLHFWKEVSVCPPSPCSPSKHKVYCGMLDSASSVLQQIWLPFWVQDSLVFILYWRTDGGTVEKLVEQTSIFYLRCLKLNLIES